MQSEAAGRPYGTTIEQGRGRTAGPPVRQPAAAPQALQPNRRGGAHLAHRLSGRQHHTHVQQSCLVNQVLHRQALPNPLARQEELGMCDALQRRRQGR